MESIGRARGCYLPLAQKARDGHAFRREGVVDSAVEPAEAFLIACEHESPCLLAEANGWLGAVWSSVEQQLHNAERDVHDGRVSAVHKSAAKPERRIRPPSAAQATALLRFVWTWRLQLLGCRDLHVDGMHHGLARREHN
jgi:hypothetical protein